jgi:mRNA interferase MazF
LLTLPFAQGAGAKKRPALVVQNDIANARMSNTIEVSITRNVSRVKLPTQLLVDPNVQQGSGLLAQSAVTCENIFTVGTNLIDRIIGKLSPDAMQQVNNCLRAALDLD